MKILHVTASYKPAYIYGGPIMSVAKLCEGIVKVESEKAKVESSKQKVESGEFNLEVFTTTANGKAELEVEIEKPILVDSVQVTYFERWTKGHSHFSPGLLLHLNKVLRKAQRDNIELILHIHAWWNLVSVLSCLIAKWYKVPVVLSPRGMLTNYSQNNRSSFSKKMMHWLIGDRLLQYCHIHVTSEQEKRDVLKIIQPQSITVIPNLVRIEEERNKVQSARKMDQDGKRLIAESLTLKKQSIDHTLPFKLLFLSRIEEKKGLEWLFNALKELDFNYHLTIAGSGEESYVASLKRKAESLKLNAHIKWLGQVANDENFSVMAEHDLLVLPSYNENFANVVIESLGVGTPVLVSKNVGLADYVKANGLGWICSLEPKDIAQKITEAYISVDKREKINDIAANIIKSDFNDEVLVGKYLELYDELHF